MKKTSLLAICLVLGSITAYAAEHTSGYSSTTDQTQPDNTKVNKRDKHGDTLTPMDQLNDKSDLRISQEIRKSIMHTHLSTDAKNIKIITRNGDVTLRGPVKSKSEVDKIIEISKSVPGIKTLNNRLDVK